MQETRNSIKNIWGDRTPYRGEWPARVDARVLEEPEQWVQSACVLCSNGCGIDIGVKDGRIVGVRGREVDRINHGRLGPKGLHGWVANNSPDRLTKPLIREDGILREASWGETMDLIVRRSHEIREEYTGDAIAFYSTGQIFIEEYYTLAVIAKAGLGTSQADGNTRLCTATAAAALRETFGADGQTGSYTDYDTTDCIFLVGHNMSSTQTVQWARILDRIQGPNPPRIVVLDPRTTVTAREATVHLAPRIGTALAVLNGIEHLLIENDWIDHDFIEKYTVGFEKLKEIVSQYTPKKVQEISGVPPETLIRAAEVLGTTPTLVSSVLQGIYQSNQATATACQVNNINLIRGLIARPGCAVLQFNGQPTAQNNRECGCNGEQPGFRNPLNPQHMEELARIWNVDPLQLPYGLPAHIMEIMKHAEEGTVRMLWVIGTNPAVSLPDLHRVREILAKPDLFVIVQDCFMTETAELADVVLPAAIWGEKTGTFTNTDRTVHISHKAVDPPGEAQPDLDILLDYARRMDFRDKDGDPLIKWNDPLRAFEAWKECSRGRLCDYSGLSYEKLTGGSGIQWPCDAGRPDGTERLYTDLVFPSRADVCESFGHNLEIGAAISPDEYRASDPDGRAMLKGARHIPPLEEPDAEYPFSLTTGRIVYHFHTRTKTGRSPELEDAAPMAFAQISEADAGQLGIRDHEMVDVITRRGTVRIPAKIGDIEQGHIFIPFHYGYWDEVEDRSRAANELTLPLWDPISKQPYFKTAAARLQKVESAQQLVPRVPGPTTKAESTEGLPAEGASRRDPAARPHVADYLGVLASANAGFSHACDIVADHHARHLEIVTGLDILKGYSREIEDLLTPFVEKYGQVLPDRPEARYSALFEEHAGEYGMIRDLHDLFIMATNVQIAATIINYAAEGLRDADLLKTSAVIIERAGAQASWAKTHLQHQTGHALVVPS